MDKSFEIVDDLQVNFNLRIRLCKEKCEKKKVICRGSRGDGSGIFVISIYYGLFSIMLYYVFFSDS